MLKFLVLLVVLILSNLNLRAEEIANDKIVPVENKITQPNLEKPVGESVNVLSIIKDLSHIFFFITMGTIGYLSYRQAKKTVFSPIRTEIFKYQLGEFENVISHFQNKSEHELKSDLDVKNLIEINAICLFRGYVETFFSGEVEFDEKNFKEKMKLATGAFVSKEYAEKHFELISLETKKELPSNIPSPTDPALKLAKWQEEKYGMVHFTEAYNNALIEIKKFQSSPLLPMELKTILGDYYDLMHQTLVTVGDAIEEAAKELPKVCSTKEQLHNFSNSWVANIHNNKSPTLEPKAKEVLSFINQYLRVDELANSKT